MRSIIQKTIQKIILGLFFVFVPFTPLYALTVDIHISEKYTNVVAGERVYFEVDVKFPENPTRQDLRFFYEITRDGEAVAQAQFLKAIETQASFIDYIVIPENAEPGLHVITATIRDYESLDEEISASFHVIANETEQLRLYFFMLLGVMLLVGALVVINIFMLKRHTEP